MNRWIANTLGFAGICAVCLIGWAAWRVGMRVPDTKPTVDRLNTTLDFINRPCASVDKDGHVLQDGPICELDQAIHDIRKITTASGKQVEQSGRLIDATADTMTQAGKSIQSEADSLKEATGAAGGTFRASTEAIDAAKALLLTANDEDKGLPAIEGNINLSMTHLDAFLKGKMLTQTLPAIAVNVQAGTAEGNAILGDVRDVADKERTDFLAPVPWWKQPIKRAGDIIDIGAAVARHAP